MFNIEFHVHHEGSKINTHTHIYIYIYRWGGGGGVFLLMMCGNNNNNNNVVRFFGALLCFLFSTQTQCVCVVIVIVVIWPCVQWKENHKRNSDWRAVLLRLQTLWIAKKLPPGPNLGVIVLSSLACNASENLA